MIWASFVNHKSQKKAPLVIFPWLSKISQLSFGNKLQQGGGRKGVASYTSTNGLLNLGSSISQLFQLPIKTKQEFAFTTIDRMERNMPVW